MTNDEDIQTWLDSLFSSIDKKDINTFSSYLTDDISFRFGNMPTSIGKATVKHQVNQFFNSIKSLQHKLTEFCTQNDSIICHGTVCYTRHDDSTLSVPFCNIFKLENQQVREYLIFADLSKLY